LLPFIEWEEETVPMVSQEKVELVLGEAVVSRGSEQQRDLIGEPSESA
jgi:hypothetical protein